MSEEMMSGTPQALILAAGRGSRLGELTDDLPKCLLDLGGGLTILKQQIMNLRANGTEEIVVVAGYRWRDVRAALAVIGNSKCRLIVNSRHAETDSLYSLWLARPWIRGPLTLLNGDVVASPGVHRILGRHDGNLLLIDCSSGEDAEHMKVALDERGDLAGLSKDLADGLARGESLGMVRLERSETEELFEEADYLVRKGDIGVSVASALERLAARKRIACHDVKPEDWVEVDYPEDLEAARAMKLSGRLKTK